jgi:agmatinase
MQHVKSLWQIGIRDAYRQPTEGLRAELQPCLGTLSAYEAETSGYDRLFDNMDRDLPWFISFDVDVLAGSERPHTATPVLGGLSFYKLLGCFERLFSEFNIVGLEFVEIGDATPSAHGTAAISARLITRFLFHLRGKTPCQTICYAPS